MFIENLTLCQGIIVPEVGDPLVKEIFDVLIFTKLTFYFTEDVLVHSDPQASLLRRLERGREIGL